ncbi:hypothetical protein DGG96_19935 [Legionella qingyii]|uniref:Uncharacterized protein n=2 Tax=Legionella qingyii TaxID=2184757 RepID=A0A317TYH2_9GAMM|nr:hypothetical protein DGG96_19935 [Legionella qingyii]RUR24177.1 hypothetical protein ELY20_06270 [Legionella qingyii]
MSIRKETGLPVLAHANLMAAAFNAIDAKDKAEDISEFIQEIVYLIDSIKIDDIIRDINEDRLVAGFPEVHAQQHIEADLAERNQYFRSVIKDALNRLPSSTLIKVVALVVTNITQNGEKHAPVLIDELVDSYEIECLEFLQKEADNIQELIKIADESASAGEKVVEPIIDKLETVVRNWAQVAKPIQLSAISRGLEHELSNTLAYSIRNLAIDLFNEHEMSNQTKRITSLINELFYDPEILARVEQDVDKLQEIIEEQKNSDIRQTEFANEITYQAEIGVIFKELLSISPNGVKWKDNSYPLEAITRVRWGGVRHSINGIPTGTRYTIAFGDNDSETVVDLRRKEIYSTFIDKLWNAVGIRLCSDILATLELGKEIKLGAAVIRDEGISFIRYKLWGKNESISCLWHQVHTWSYDGKFYIGMKEDKKTYIGLSYINDPNIHILELVLQVAFKKPGIRLLSDTFKEN